MKQTIVLILFLLLLAPLISADCIDINTASSSQLDNIIWVGPATAEKIISARPFSTLDDLIKVYGIGEVKLQDIRDQGLACVDGKTEEKQEESKESESRLEIIEEKETTPEPPLSPQINLNPNANIINLNSDEIITKEVIAYESKNSKISKYSIYAFALLLIFLMAFILLKK